jgi:hypothetical protein
LLFESLFAPAPEKSLQSASGWSLQCEVSVDLGQGVIVDISLSYGDTRSQCERGSPRNMTTTLTGLMVGHFFGAPYFSFGDPLVPFIGVNILLHGWEDTKWINL